MTEDLIDFPCSALWLGFYAERGLRPETPLPSLITKKPIELHAETEAEFYMARPWIAPSPEAARAMAVLTQQGITVAEQPKPPRPPAQRPQRRATKPTEKVVIDVGDISRF